MRSGFTFMEVMISTVIIGVVAAFLASTMLHSLDYSSGTQDIAKATDLAQRYLETIKSDFTYKLNYDNSLPGATPPIPVTSDFNDGGYFTVQTTVTDLETEVINGINVAVLKEVDIEYLRASDSLSMVSLSTLISRPR